jgi:protein SCO1/2
MKNSRKKWLPVALLLPLLILGGGSYLKLKKNQLPPEISGFYLNEPEFIVPFQLSTANGEIFTDEDLKGEWTLMFFGFTYCPDVCPTTLAMLDVVLNHIKEEYPYMKPPQVVFVSIDPERDTLEQIQRYVNYFNEDFIGVTGSAVQLSKLSRQLGIVYEKVFPSRGDGENYLMEHSTSIIMVNPRGAMQAVFTSPHDVQNLTSDIKAVYNRGV